MTTQNMTHIEIFDTLISNVGNSGVSIGVYDHDMPPAWIIEPNVAGILCRAGWRYITTGHTGSTDFDGFHMLHYRRPRHYTSITLHGLLDILEQQV